MADTIENMTGTAQSVELTPEDPQEISTEDFKQGFGEDLQKTLNLGTWSTGESLDAVYSRIEAEVREAVTQEQALQRVIRAEIFPRLADYQGAPRGAGVYKASPTDIKRIHTGLLFNGGVEACDGTRQIHDTLPLTIYQIGVSLVSYQGNQGTWGHRLFRRDLRMTSDNPVNEMIRLLERREQRGGLNQPGRRDKKLTELAQRGIMSHAERAILLERSSATWRMGHGNPAPYELITGSGYLDLMIEATKVIRRLVEIHQKFVFVASEPSDRFLLTIGQALHPLEYAIVRTLQEVIYDTVENGHYKTQRYTTDTTWDGKKLTYEEWIRRFRDEVASQVVVGVYRATSLAPAQVFYAHVNHADIAAHIALADSVLQEHRGFPLLLDLADNVCSAVFGGDTLSGPCRRLTPMPALRGAIQASEQRDARNPRVKEVYYGAR